MSLWVKIVLSVMYLYLCFSLLSWTIYELIREIKLDRKVKKEEKMEYKEE